MSQPLEFPTTPQHGRPQPDLITLHYQWNRLTTDPFGEIEGGLLQGYFSAGARLVSHFDIKIDGKRPNHTFSSQISQERWNSVALCPGSMEQGNLPEGHVPRGSLDLTINRLLRHHWEERVTLTNNDSRERSFELQIELSCPLEDVEFEEEMKVAQDEPPKTTLPQSFHWEELDGQNELLLRFYRDFGLRQHAPHEELKRTHGENSPKDGERVFRGLDLALIIPSDWEKPRLKKEHDGLLLLSARLNLKAKEKRNFTIQFRPNIPDKDKELIEFTSRKSAAREEQKGTPLHHTQITTSHSLLNQVIEQAQADLRNLEIFDENPVFHAGLPRYMGVFSRDVLTTAWQAGFLCPDYIPSALQRIVNYRGVRKDAWRDEEINRIPHERRVSPAAAVGETNREIYYGDVASTPFWIVTLATHFHWRGEIEELKKHEQDFYDCLDWVQRKLEDGDGYIYYEPAAETRYNNRHHAWKDSGDAIVDGQGRIVLPPIATAEVQGYAFLALLSAVEIALALKQPKKALTYFEKAMKLKERFNRDFWMPEKRFYAMGLTPGKKQIDAIASNIGHCLGSGFLDDDKVPLVVARLFSKDMYSGWGIRTLSTENPAYDPFSYHRGSVWPVENSTIAAGLAISGYPRHALQVINDQLNLITYFEHNRLPEVASGHERNGEIASPGLYPHANLLQAWSVSAVSLFVQTLLGIRPIAPLRTVLTHPIFPDWLEWIELKRLKVGNSEMDLLFEKDSGGKVKCKVSHRNGPRLFVKEKAPAIDDHVQFLARISERLLAS